MTTLHNITKHSVRELSLIVFNTQHLYSEMMRILDAHINPRPIGVTTEGLLKQLIADQGYKYTQSQWNIFKSDVSNHYNEMMSKVLQDQIQQATQGL